MALVRYTINLLILTLTFFFQIGPWPKMPLCAIFDMYGHENFDITLKKIEGRQNKKKEVSR